MDLALNNNKFTVGDWSVEPTSNLLINKNIKRRIKPKVMELLVYMANARGEVVARDDVLDAVWQEYV